MKAETPPAAPPADRSAGERGLSLRANFSWTLVGNVIYAACQWGMLTILVKLGDPEIVGRLSLGLAVTAPIFMLSNLQLRALQATETTGTLQFADFAGLRLVATALAVLAAQIAAWAGGYGPELAWTIAGLGLSRAVDSSSDVIQGELQRRERMDLLAGSMMLRGFFSVGALAAAFAWSGSLAWAVLGMAAANLVVFLAYDVRKLVQVHRGALRELWPRFEASAMRRILGDALPLGAVMMLISLNVNIPRYFIEASFGEYLLGIFAPLAQLVAAGGLVVNALGQSATPRLARLHAAGDLSGFKRILGIMLGLALLLCVAGVGLIYLVGAPILTLLYSAEYAEYTGLLYRFAVLAGVQFAGSFLGYGMTSARRYRVQLPLFLLATVVCSLGSWLLVPRLGLEGAIYALLASALVQLCGSAWILSGALQKLTAPAAAEG